MNPYLYLYNKMENNFQLNYHNMRMKEFIIYARIFLKLLNDLYIIIFIIIEKRVEYYKMRNFHS